MPILRVGRTDQTPGLTQQQAQIYQCLPARQWFLLKRRRSARRTVEHPLGNEERVPVFSPWEMAPIEQEVPALDLSTDQQLPAVERVPLVEHLARSGFVRSLSPPSTIANATTRALAVG